MRNAIPLVKSALIFWMILFNAHSSQNPKTCKKNKAYQLGIEIFRSGKKIAPNLFKHCPSATRKQLRDEALKGIQDALFVSKNPDSEHWEIQAISQDGPSKRPKHYCLVQMAGQEYEGKGQTEPIAKKATLNKCNEIFEILDCKKNLECFKVENP